MQVWLCWLAGWLADLLWGGGEGRRGGSRIMKKKKDFIIERGRRGVYT